MNAELPRKLTAGEATLVTWLLEHGSDEAREFVAQVGALEVVETCPCGCPSIDFVARRGRGFAILSDYQFVFGDGYLGGVFVFADGPDLVGLDVWSIDGLAVPPLPTPDMLQPFR